MKINNYVKKNWETLPKSRFDDLELVMVKQLDYYEGGWGHHSYEGYGIDREGNFRWMFSSGCSCNGGPSENDTIKSLVVEDEDLNEIEWKEIDFASLVVEFDTY